DRAGGAVVLLDPVAGWQAVEVVAFHGAGGATALRGAGDVHGLAGLEQVGGEEQLADLELRRRVETELADIALRLGVGVGGRRPPAGLATPLRLQFAGDVAAFGARRPAARLVLEAELHGEVTVAGADTVRTARLRPLRFDLQHGAGPHLQNGDGG